MSLTFLKFIDVKTKFSNVIEFFTRETFVRDNQLIDNRIMFMIVFEFDKKRRCD